MRARRPVRVAGALLLACAGGGLTAVTASADTATLSTAEGSGAGATVRVVVRGADGRTRRLPPFRLPRAPGGLLASPDGSRLLLLPDAFDGGGGGAHLLPIAGGPVVPLVLPADVRIDREFAQVSFTPDGSEVVIGDALRQVLPAGTDPDAVPVDTGVSWTALRCAVSTGVCAELPAPGGTAVGVPGGAVVSSSRLSAFPARLTIGADDGGSIPDFVDGDSDLGRLLRGTHDEPRSSVTRFVPAAASGGPTERVIGRSDRPPSRGLPVSEGAVGGASGALLQRYTFTTRLPTEGARVGLRTDLVGPRLLTVRPDGNTSTGPLPRVRIARRDLCRAFTRPATSARSLRVVPVLGRPDAGWIGVATRIPELPATFGTALATIDPDGSARVVRVGGRAATAERLVAAAGLGRLDYVIRLTVVGYERTTGSAVVTVRWGQELGPRSARVREETLRVALGGDRRPELLRDGADTAW